MKRLVLTIALLLFLTGCSGEGTKAEAEEGGETPIQIGLSFDTFVVERWQRDRDVFVSTASELGAQVNVQNANGDVQEQIAQLEYFIEKKVDVIVVVPIEAESLAGTIKKAREKGIRVISYDRLAINSHADLYISFDNETVGTLMGEAVSDQLNRGDQVLMICGPVSDNNVSLVRKGFLEELERKEIEVLDTVYIDGWKAELAADYISENMEQVRQVQAIMCGNDNLAGQVIRVLAENRLAGSVCVVGQDADLEACQRIVEGTQYMTVYKPVEKLAKCAAEAAVALAEGEELETADLIFDGSWEIPYIRLDLLAVTSQNMDDIIVDSGFHLKEDIYIDRPNVLP